MEAPGWPRPSPEPLAGAGGLGRRRDDALWHTPAVAATGLSGDPKEYRARLTEQSDGQLDAWVEELMRDVVIRRGIVKVVKDFRSAAKLSEGEFERVFASGGGAPATLGRDRQGNLIVPTISLHTLVPGLRARVDDARDRLIDYLVANFGELVYV
jgi:hypothetical protein